MRLRHVWTVGIVVCSAFGALAAAAFADSAPGPGAGGATAPVGTTGATGATGTTGSTGTTGASGTAGATSTLTAQVITTTSPLAPIVLGKGVSPTAVYGGPVYVESGDGVIEPYVPQTQMAAVAGGTLAGTFSPGLPHLVVPGNTAEIINGHAAAPENAPLVVQEIIWAANKIVGRPYVYGGGHRSFISFGYDCSGTVSYALHGGHLLKSPLDSGQFMSWGKSGQGQWMSILTNPGHAYLDIAGLRLDTSAADDPTDQQGPRWRPLRPANAGYTVRHPAGF